MKRLSDLSRFYALLDRLTVTIGGSRLLSECDGRMDWPKRGVYFFFEDGEVRSDSGDGPRVVRVGTHALKSGSKTKLWNRLSQHRGSAESGGGNHRGSIFRLLVGDAIMARHPSRAVATWGQGSSAESSIREAERPAEFMVSTAIGAMPFVWVPIDDAPGPDSVRGVIERGSIALLSNSRKSSLDSASGSWLGSDCTRNRVVASDLWNQIHVDESYDPEFLDALETLIDAGPTSDGRSRSASATTADSSTHSQPSPEPSRPPTQAVMGGTNADRICELLAVRPDLDDDEISRRTGISPRQQVNQICRRLERQRVLRRFSGPSGKIVNRLRERRARTVVSPTPAVPTPGVEEPIRPTAVKEEEHHRGNRSSLPSELVGANLVNDDLVPSNLASTLFVLPCSGSKSSYPPGHREAGERILEALPPELAAELLSARASVRVRAEVDETTLVPAWKRYSGTLYQCAGAALAEAVEADRKILILSGGYGVVLATEPIGYYEAVFKPSWWPRGLLERVLCAYAASEGVESVRALASASTSYRKVVENTIWGSNVRDALLLMPLSVGGGAMVKTPRAQGEALASLLRGPLTKGWTSTDGLSLDSVSLGG